jgi:hypothetical protein
MINNYNIPTNWSGVTLEKGMKIESLSASTFNSRDLYFKEIAEILSEQSLDEISIEESERVKFQISELMTSEKNTELKYIYEFGGIKYGLQYDLTAKWWGQMTSEESMFENANSIWEIADKILACIIRPIKIKELKKEEKKFWNISKRRKRIKEMESELLQNQYKLEKFNFESVEERAEILRTRLLMSEVYPLVFFFIKIGNRYLKLMSIILKEELKIQT